MIAPDDTSPVPQSPTPKDPTSTALAPFVELLTPLATAVATQAAQDASAELHKGTIAMVAGVQQQVTANAERIEELLAGAGTAVLGSIAHDTVTQRHMALLVVAFLGAITLSFVIAYLAGSATAKGIVGWALAPGVGGLALAWAATGLKLPKTNNPGPV